MKLSAKTKKALEPCKFFEAHQKKAMIPLLEYIDKLESQVKGLEQELRDVRQPLMFERPAEKYVHGNLSVNVGDDLNGVNTKELAAHLLKEHGLDSTIVQAFIKRRGWDTAKFMEYAAKTMMNE